MKPNPHIHKIVKAVISRRLCFLHFVYFAAPIMIMSTIVLSLQTRPGFSWPPLQGMSFCMIPLGLIFLILSHDNDRSNKIAIDVLSRALSPECNLAVETASCCDDPEKIYVYVTTRDNKVISMPGRDIFVPLPMSCEPRATVYRTDLDEILSQLALSKVTIQSPNNQSVRLQGHTDPAKKTIFGSSNYLR